MMEELSYAGKIKLAYMDGLLTKEEMLRKLEEIETPEEEAQRIKEEAEYEQYRWGEEKVEEVNN